MSYEDYLKLPQIVLKARHLVKAKRRAIEAAEKERLRKLGYR